MSAVIINLGIPTIAGVIGGNAMGAGMKDASLGATGNTFAGALGGLGGGQLVGALLSAASAGGGSLDDIGYIIGQLIGGGAGGAILTAILGVIKNAMAGRELR